MSDFVGDVLGFVDARGTVIRCAPCRNCSFDLCGQPQTGQCPECGAPIAVSLCGDYLRSANPRWLNTVASGIMLVLWGMLIAFGLALVAGFARADEPVVKQVLVTGGLAVGLCGAWLMTRPEPGGIGESRKLSARRLVRTAVVASLAGAVVQLVAGLTDVGPGVRAIVAIVSGLAVIVGEFAKLRYLQQLAARLPDQKLVWRAGGLKWALVVAYSLLILAGAIAAAAKSSMNFAGGPDSDNIVNAFGVAAAMAWAVPGALAVVVVTFMIIDLLYRASKAIRAQMPRATVPTATDEAFISPLPTTWPGRATESAPVVPLRVAPMACGLAMPA